MCAYVHTCAYLVTSGVCVVTGFGLGASVPVNSEGQKKESAVGVLWVEWEGITESVSS